MTVQVGQPFTLTNPYSSNPAGFNYSYSCYSEPYLGEPCNQTYLAGVRNNNTFTFTRNATYAINLCEVTGLTSVGPSLGGCIASRVTVGNGDLPPPPPIVSLSPTSINVSANQRFTITNTTSGGVKPYAFSNYSYTCYGSSPGSASYLSSVYKGNNSFIFTQEGTYYINLCASSYGSGTGICAATFVNVR